MKATRQAADCCYRCNRARRGFRQSGADDQVLKRFLPVLLLLPAISAGDWPDFRGPERAGVYDGGDVAAVQPAAGPPLVWRTSVGAGFANPIVADGKVILFHRRGGSEIVEALDRSNGETVWKHEYATAYRDDFGFDNGPRASPVAVGGQVYTFGAQGVLSCLRLADGGKIWSRELHQEYGVRKGYFGAAGTPLVEGGRVFLNLGGADGAGIVALDKDTGRLLWKATDHEAGYSSPISAMLNGRRRIVFLTREGVVVAEPSTGEAVYEKHWRSRSNASVNAATPVLSGQTIFFSASYGTGAITIDFSAAEPRELWSGEDALANHYSTAVASGGVLYGYHGRQEYGQSLRAVELRSGKVLWEEPGFKAGTVTLAGDLLLLLREDGELVIARVDRNKFSPTSRSKILPGVVRAYPAIADGILYARNEDTLVAVDLRGESR
jgi:outer membrane protein assembly factor BamB